ncbi:glycosyltransferase family protein [Sphingomonas aestuarii]
MRILQNINFYSSNAKIFSQSASSGIGYIEQKRSIIESLLLGSHILEPVLDCDESTFLSAGNLLAFQKQWAREHGWNNPKSESEILLAQLESHRSEVFYNLDPVRFDDNFIAKLPGCVKVKIAWLAAPSRSATFNRYDRIVNNFPSILLGQARRGLNSEYFFPSHDERLNRFSNNSNREVDIVFVGGFSRHHLNRTAMLGELAILSEKYKIALHLDLSKATKIAETPFGFIPPLRRFRRSAPIKRISQPPLFGRSMFERFSNSKVVVNGAIDMAGGDRGNLRCWEALGCGSLLLTDKGSYPAGFEQGKTHIEYDSGYGISNVLEDLLSNPELISSVSRAGHRMISSVYSKSNQWKSFQQIIGGV